jgi:hypothetical protein
MLTEFLDLERWAQWFSSLEREFIFLLALPFVVAIVGLWGAWVDKEQEEEHEPAVQATPPAAHSSPAERERRAQSARRGLGHAAPHSLK